MNDDLRKITCALLLEVMFCPQHPVQSPRERHQNLLNLLKVKNPQTDFILLSYFDVAFAKIAIG